MGLLMSTEYGAVRHISAALPSRQSSSPNKSAAVAVDGLSDGNRDGSKGVLPGKLGSKRWEDEEAAMAGAAAAALARNMGLDGSTAVPPMPPPGTPRDGERMPNTLDVAAVAVAVNPN